MPKLPGTGFSRVDSYDRTGARMSLRVLLLVMVAVASACSPAAVPEAEAPASTPPASANRDTFAVEEVDLSPQFGGIAGTFVMLDARKGRLVVHNLERARTRFLPASTFKIPNSLIALET